MSGLLNPFGAPKSLLILNSSNFVEKKGFHAVKALTPNSENAFLVLPKRKGQTTESGIPQPFRATVRYSKIHLGF